MSRIEKEKKTVQLMINIYCKKNHKCTNKLCEECNEILNYAHKRLDAYILRAYLI
jgi:predicted nucleic acid-binding Zn ribbon protein